MYIFYIRAKRQHVTPGTVDCCVIVMLSQGGDMRNGFYRATLC